ncbi:unknown [Clostridium sp. CAG:557]|jgi:hypothetical protein|nr:unknown [Clostridium sp. CAG:557]
MQDFLDGLLDYIISEWEVENSEYKACKEEEKNNADKFEELLDRLSKKDRDFINKHESNIFIIASAEQSYIYYRGYKYCIKFLKTLEMI